MYEDKVREIENFVKELFKRVLNIEVRPESKITLKGLEITLDCDKEKKGMILGKKGRTMRNFRRIVKIMGKYVYGGNIEIFLKPDNNEKDKATI